MQRGGNSGGSSVAALHARMRGGGATESVPTPPPRQKKAKSQELADVHDERAAKAERHSLAQHQTSLLSTPPKNDRLNPRKERKRTPFLMQLFLVMLVAGGVAVALDPNLMAQAKAYVEPHIDTVREMLNV
jgi:hypothetical protein